MRTQLSECIPSHSGLVIKFGKTTVFFKSTKQKLVTKSSGEAELVAATDIFPAMCYVRDWLLEKGMQVMKMILYQDN